ncbi:hypothetical protein RDI58_025005 [Solanum bulbocastanum]|uniref:peroxidase n=1 Tax=Solanum bulbocastanum TaxID=147425 RepID=A0AAN8Y3Z0_SOLBU
MASSYSFVFLHILVMFCLENIAFPDLSNDFYDDICPQALPTIKRVVEDAIRQERRMGASLLRLHFHDCFVNGCDASILLDQTTNIDSEKTSRDERMKRKHLGNFLIIHLQTCIYTMNGFTPICDDINSTRGFEVIDRIRRLIKIVDVQLYLVRTSWLLQLVTP